MVRSLERAAPQRLLRAAVGVLSAAVGIGLAHALAGLAGPASSPLLAVGSVAVDAAPTPVKEWAVRTLGTADKPVLLAGVGAVLVLLTAMLGLAAFRRLWIGVVGMLALAGVAGAAAAARIAEPSAVLPAALAGLASSLTLALLIRAVGASQTAGEGAGSGQAPGTLRDSPLAGTHVRAGRFRPARRGVLLGGPALVAAAGLGAGALIGRLRSGDAAVGRDRALPEPSDPAERLPDGVQPAVPGITPFVTANPDFYRVDIALTTPRVDADSWSLPITGMIERPTTLTYTDILEMPMIERWITLSCVSNQVGGPYVSTARWLGVPLRELLERVGVQSGAEQIFATGADGFSCSVPLAAVMDGRDAMLAIGMNGEQLPVAHGFPARLLVPGLFGFVSAAKWLTGLRLTTYADDVAYWTERGWATDAPALTQTRIDVPEPLARVPAGEVMIAGMAWAQHRGVAEVEVRVDEGDWERAELAADAGKDLWRAWSYRWSSTGSGRHDVEVRTTDRTGQTQPRERTEPFPDGARGWHSVAFVVDA